MYKIKNIPESEKWEFVDLDIATDPQEGWSFPGIPLHIDHILVSNELFGALSDSDFAVEVIPLDTMAPGGAGYYLTNLSDHLPVAVRLDF